MIETTPLPNKVLYAIAQAVIWVVMVGLVYPFGGFVLGLGVLSCGVVIVASSPLVVVAFTAMGFWNLLMTLAGSKDKLTSVLLTAFVEGVKAKRLLREAQKNAPTVE